MWLEILETVGKVVVATVAIVGAVAKAIGEIRTRRARRTQQDQAVPAGPAQAVPAPEVGPPQRPVIEFLVEDHEVTYFPVTPQTQSHPMAGAKAEESHVGSYLKFDGHMKTGLRQVVVDRIGVELDGLSSREGSRGIGVQKMPWPLKVEADDYADVVFFYHLNDDPTATLNMPPQAQCLIHLVDQEELTHSFTFTARFREHPGFSTRRI